MTSDKFMVNSDAQRMAATRYAIENFYGEIWFVGDGKKCEIYFDTTLR